MRVVLLRRALIVSASLLLSGCLSLEDFKFWDSEARGTAGESTPNTALRGGASGDQDPQSQDTLTRTGKTKERPKVARLEVGDRFTFDNPSMTWEIVKIAKERIRWRGDDGEIHVTGMNPILPALEWSSPKGEKGRRLIRDVTGSLFPMRVGAKTTFRSTVTSNRSPFGWQNNWTCTVQGTEVLQWRGHPLETFVVGCGRKRTNELTFNYAAEVGHYIVQRTFQGAGKPELLRRLISVTYASEAREQRNISAAKKQIPTKIKAPRASVESKAPVIKAAPLRQKTPEPVAHRTIPRTSGNSKHRQPSKTAGDLKKLLDSVIIKTPNFSKDATGAGVTEVFSPRPRVTKAPQGSVRSNTANAASTSSRPLRAPPLLSVPVPVRVDRKTPLLIKVGPRVPKAVRPTRTRPLPVPPPPSKRVAIAQGERFAPSVSAPPETLGHGVHLASYRSERMALRGWGILKSQANGALDSRNAVLRKIHIEGKGEFVRLYAGASMARSDAVQLCAALNKVSLSCDVIGLTGK